MASVSGISALLSAEVLKYTTYNHVTTLSRVLEVYAITETLKTDTVTL